ncbi:MAG: helix-turn-helix domain-containing protein [Ruminococcus sp.]|nr:helix-turn-helix domain-containing protein [Ruminococcus sp.]
MKKKPLIGIVISILARNHIRNIVRGALAQVNQAGCDCIVLAPLCHFTQCEHEHSEAERSIYQMILSDAFDGFLYIKDDVTMGSEVIQEVEELLLSSQKYVMTVDEREHPIFNSTQYDDYYDFGKVVRHLIEVHEYKKIYCLTGPQVLFQAQTRLKAYQDQMTEHGLYFDESYYSYGTFWVDSAINYAQKIISEKLPRPEAIVCGNDVTAIALIKTLMSAGIRVPEDIAVTGYDGYLFAANIDVTLTTYNRNHYQLGADAMRRLYRNLTGTLCSQVHHPESGFIIGSSCGCSTVPIKQTIQVQNETVPKMWEEDIFCDDLPFNLAKAQNVSDLLQRSLFHARKLYQVKSLRIYMHEQDGFLRCAASQGDDSNAEFTFSEKDAAGFLQNNDASEIIFLSPLHFQKRDFGMIALTFEVPERIYDHYYLLFVTQTELALDRLTVQESRIKENSIHTQHREEIRNHLTYLRESIRKEPGKPWKVEQMCRIAGMGKSTLQKQYKSCFGKSIFEELIQFRVELAKHLLKDTALSLGEISKKCGYSSDSYFMKQFKSITGTTPSAFRKKIQ